MRSFFVSLFMLATLLVSVPSDAGNPPLSDDAVLAGSPDALATENRAADQYDLTRLRDVAQMQLFVDAGRLVQITNSSGYFIDETLGELDTKHATLYAHARTWVKVFLDDLAADPLRPAGMKLKITSLVRTVAYQEQLRKKYPAATSATAPGRRSSHLTGSTVDISTKDMSEEGKAWLRKKLAVLERRGLMQATEEKGTSLCFHVMVFPDYPTKR